MTHCLSRVVLLHALWLFAGATALAAPIPGGLSISGTVSLDTDFSSDVSTGATQSGTLSHVVGGATVSTSFSGDPASISPPSLTGAFAATGDGLGASFSMSGSGAGANNFDGLFADFSFSLTNSSATETFVILFGATIANSTSASGSNSFVFSEISVKDSSFNELLYSTRQTDTVNGNIDDSSSNLTFALTLNPGDIASFSALQRQRGSVEGAGGGSFSSNLDAFLFIDSIETRGGNPNPVPLPGTLPLVALGLGLLSLKRRS